MKLEVNISETVTPEEVANEIFNDMYDLDTLISNATGCVIDTKDCYYELSQQFNNLNKEKRTKWFAEVLKELVKYFE